jgi:hypothetical protein
MPSAVVGGGLTQLAADGHPRSPEGLARKPAAEANVGRTTACNGAWSSSCLQPPPAATPGGGRGRLPAKRGESLPVTVRALGATSPSRWDLDHSGKHPAWQRPVEIHVK